jgi:hypothetical protein
MKYTGSCHCGNVSFEVEGSLTAAMSCNCSMCRRKGWLMWFVPRESMHLTRQEGVSTYLFNKHVVRHHFCSRCGIQPYGEAPAPDGKPMAAINVRCLDDVEPESVPVTHYDGRAK